MNAEAKNLEDGIRTINDESAELVHQINRLATSSGIVRVGKREWRISKFDLDHRIYYVKFDDGIMYRFSALTCADSPKNAEMCGKYLHMLRKGDMGNVAWVAKYDDPRGGL